MMEYSPILAMATGTFELALAWYAFNSPGRKSVLRPTGLILVFLAGYQWLEVFACSHVGVSLPARMALADVIWLPPLGVLLVSRLASPGDKVLQRCNQFMFAMAASLAAYIMVHDGFVRQTVCRAVIATYHAPGVVYQVYGGFYQFGLMAMIFGSAVAMVRSDDSLTRRHLADVQMGTLGFVLPSLMMELVFPVFNTSTPSVMCHFALVLAIFLSRLIVRERKAYGEQTPEGQGTGVLGNA